MSGFNEARASYKGKPAELKAFMRGLQAGPVEERQKLWAYIMRLDTSDLTGDQAATRILNWSMGRGKRTQAKPGGLGKVAFKKPAKKK